MVNTKRRYHLRPLPAREHTASISASSRDAVYHCNPFLRSRRLARVSDEHYELMREGLPPWKACLAKHGRCSLMLALWALLSASTAFSQITLDGSLGPKSPLKGPDYVIGP